MTELARILRQQRVMRELTLEALSEMSGVSASHLGRIERGERFPSAHILRNLAKPLGLAEAELLTLAGYLSAQPSEAEKPSGVRLDPYVVTVLSLEPVEVQRAVVGLLSVLKVIAQVQFKLPEFREYAHRKYPELDEDSITMIEEAIEEKLAREKAEEPR